MSYFNFFTQHTDYGSARTRTFAQIFPTFEEFQAFWNLTTFSKQAVALSQVIPEGEGPQNLNLIYELLMAEYANSNIASSDENRFKFQCMSLIFQYAPAWIKRLEIQHELHEMDLGSDEFLRGSMSVFNTALNPETGPGTDSLDTISTINQQNVNIQKRDKFKSLAILAELLETNITDEFIRRFKVLFTYIVAPQRPLFYTTEVHN